MVINLSVVGDCVASERHLLKERLGRIRDVRVDENGAVYVLTDGGEGTLYRLQPEPEDVAGKTHL
jgi:glucose/arabinose dehydrogenase